MGRTQEPAAARLRALEREVSRLRTALASSRRSLAKHEVRLRELGKATEDQRRRQAVVADALQLGERPRRGDRGIVADLQDGVARLEDYLLKTADRIENILTALRQHREFLVSVNKRVLSVGTKDRIRLELDVMKNTLSVLALNGVDLDLALVHEIDRFKKSLASASDFEELEREKAQLDKKFDVELKKFDLDSIWSRKKEIAGYV